MFNGNTHTFSNGFRVIYEKSPNHLPITAVNVICDVGSIDEPANLRGVSHLIEHVCFKGTSKYANSKDIYIQYDKIGAYINAYTTNRYTGYVVKCDSQFIRKSLQILADMILHSVFNRAELVNEHQVVVEENIKSLNSAEEVILTETSRAIYRGSSFENPVDDLSYHLSKNGDMRTDALDYADIMAFYRRFYRPKNMILSIVSNLPFDKIIRILKTSDFVKHPPQMADVIISTPARNDCLAAKTGAEIKIIQKKGIENVLFAMAFRVCGNNHPDKYCLEFISNLLANTMSGRFFILLREKKSLVYNINIYTNYYDNIGDFTVFTQTDKRKLLSDISGHKKNGLVPSIVAIFNDLIKHGITEEELHTIKGFIRGKTLIDNENIDNQSFYNGTQLLMGGAADKIVSLQNVYSEFIENLTREQIHSAIRRYFTPANLCVSVMGGGDLPSKRSIETAFREFM
jgi:predicted Zn-dependent peptidase